MADVQNLAELAMITVRGKVTGFDQEDLDAFFAELDEADDDETLFDVDEFTATFYGFRDWLADLDKETGVVSTVAQPFLHFYTLWAYVNEVPPATDDVTAFGESYGSFMEAVHAFVAFDITQAGLASREHHEFCV